MNEYLFLIPIGFALTAGVVSPGPSFILVAQTAMEKSRAHGIAASFGMGLGSIVFALVTSLGLFVVLEAVPQLYVGIKFIGGLYLCYISLIRYEKHPVIPSSLLPRLVKK